MKRTVALVFLLAAINMLFGSMVGVAEAGPVGGGHPYYTEEELEAIHENSVEEVTLRINEQDGDRFVYEAPGDGLYNPVKGNGLVNATADDIEEAHDNMQSMVVTVKEVDGDRFEYLHDATTGDYYKALN